MKTRRMPSTPRSVISESIAVSIFLRKM